MGLSTFIWFMDVKPVKIVGGWIAIEHLGLQVNPVIGRGKTPKAAMVDWRFRMNKRLKKKHGWFMKSAPKRLKRIYQNK